MAETLGTVASILQLVDTALKAREYILDFVHAPQEQQKLLSEMDDLRPLLAELHTRIVGNPSSRVLQKLKSPLANFKATMEQFTQKLRPGDEAFSKFSKQLKWTLWSKKEAKEYLDKFEQFKSLLNSWLLLDLCDMGQQHHDVVLSSLDNVASGVVNIGDTISEQQQQMNSAERTQIIDWLSPINFFLRQTDISRVRQAGTGGWLLDDPSFQEWKSGSGKTLWCHGIPGAGKTILASMVTDHLTVEFENQNIGVACMYLNHKEAEEQTPAKLLSGLWRQLVFDRDLGSQAKKLYHKHHEKRTSPSLDEVFDVLLALIGEYSKVYVIVDAVDEYPEAQRQILLEYLVMMRSTVNLMITSRPHIRPDGSLPNLVALEIRANEDDICRYVEGQIQKSSWLSKHIQTRADLREEILSTIARTVDGMFLLAKLHIESLSKKSTIKRVREALKTLPRDLNDSYDSAMKRIQDQNEEERNIAHSALTWVVNAKRPLTVAELQVALAVEPGAQELDDDNILDIEIILAVCAGLVIMDEQLTAVRSVHYTTQEYFDSIQEQQFPDAQIEITRTLLTFLSINHSVDMFQYRDDNLPPLMGYCDYCLVHAAGPQEHQLRNMILEFFGLASRWMKAMKWTWWCPPWDFPAWPSQPSILWMAAAANLLETATFLLEEAPHLDNQEISVASYYGYLQMVQLLVGHGADVNAQGGFYGNPLQAASSGGHINVVQLLIEHSADVNAQGGDFENALQAASDGGHIDIVQLLIEHGANVNAQGGYYGNALQAASYNGHINIVQLLIEHGVNVNVQGGKFGNALQPASRNGHMDIVQLLIEHSADVNAQGGRFGNALQAASSNGHINIVQLLIEHSADVNAQGGEYGSALQAASGSGHINIAQLLIEYGADANAQGGYHGNVLQAASYWGHIDIVQLLIEHGADVNAQGGEYRNALQGASFNGHMNMVQLLIDQGADVHAQGGKYGSALKAALYRGTDRELQLIMDDDNTLIQHLENIAQLLRNNGAYEDPHTLWDNAISEHHGQQSADESFDE